MLSRQLPPLLLLTAVPSNSLTRWRSKNWTVKNPHHEQWHWWYIIHSHHPLYHHLLWRSGIDDSKINLLCMDESIHFWTLWNTKIYFRPYFTPLRVFHNGIQKYTFNGNILVFVEESYLDSWRVSWIKNALNTRINFWEKLNQFYIMHFRFNLIQL